MVSLTAIAAIHPHVTGCISDMRKAVFSHPFMLLYLDQHTSVAPNFRARAPEVGLNDKLARELLIRHKLDVDATYSQNQVRQLGERVTEFGQTAGAN